MPAWVGPPPRPGRAAAAVEDRQLDAAGGRDARQLLLRAVDLPLRGEVAAVLARVGVADHHLEAPAWAAVEELLDERAAARRSSIVSSSGTPSSAAPASRASASPRARRRPSASSRRSGGRRHALPCLACALAAAASVLRRRSSGSRIAEAWTRRSSFARWRPNVRARARRSARRPSATRSPRCARSSASRCVEIRHELAAVRVGVVSEPLPDRDEHGAERLVGVAELGHAADHRRRHPPRRAELAELVPVEVACELPGALERVGDRLGADVRVAVEVTADPAAEAQRLAGALRAARRAPARAPGSRSRSSARRTRAPAGSRRRPAAAWSGSRRSARAA